MPSATKWFDTFVGKGNHESVKKGRKPRKRRLKGKRGRGTAATIKPIIEKFIKSDSLVNTDEYDIYGRLAECTSGGRQKLDRGISYGRVLK